MRGLATTVLAAVVLASGYVLFSPSPGGPPAVQHLDKAVHAALFAALAASARWRFGRPRAVLAAVAAYALLSEVVQALALPGRSGDPADLLADVGGAVVGLLLAGAVLRAVPDRRARRRSQTRQTCTTDGRG